MIPVVFKTNVDCPVGTWVFPKETCCRPLVGDLVRANNQILKVAFVYHAYGKLHSSSPEVPYLEVTLVRFD